MNNILSFLNNKWYYPKIVVTILLGLSLQSYAIEPAKVSFKCNIHTINKVEGQTKCAPLDDKFGGYCIIEKSKHKGELVGHMGLLLLRDSFTGRIWAYDLLCPTCYNKGQKNCIRMQTLIVARCEKCNSEWQNIHMGSAGQTNQEGKYWLIAYKTELNEDFLYITNY
jgi:hypothetical protein